MARKRRSMIKPTLFITLIATMNLIGISYGHWQDSLTSEMRISTGNIRPYFYDKVEVEKVGDIIITDEETGDDYVWLAGEIESGKTGMLEFNYTVMNDGSVPIKFDDKAFKEYNQQLLDNEVKEFKLLGSKQYKKVLFPYSQNIPDKGHKNVLKLKIDAPEEPDEYSFSIMIPYRQYTHK